MYDEHDHSCFAVCVIAEVAFIIITFNTTLVFTSLYQILHVLELNIIISVVLITLCM